MYYKGLDAILESAKKKRENDACLKKITPVPGGLGKVSQTPRPPPSCTNKDPVKESETKIKKALAVIVSAAKDRSEALKANTCRNNFYDEKDAIFNNLKCSMDDICPAAVIGNNVFRASKRNEVDTAMEELEIKKKCDIIYDEKECIKYFNEHKPVLLQMAMQFFSRANTAKCSGLDVSIKCGANKFTNKVLIKRKSGNEEKVSSPSITIFEVKSVPRRAIEKNFAPVSSTSELKPTDRIDLDVTKAEASHVFSTLRRLDVKRPLYFAGKTFYQRKPTHDNKFRWTEVVGWDETEASKMAVKAINPTVDDLFVLPSSFKRITVKLMEKYKHLLIRNTNVKKKRGYYKVSDALMNPKIDSAMENKEILKRFDGCLDALLTLGKSSAFTKSTVDQYRSKFRRYLVFCFAFYALNMEKHSNSVTPLPFNFFNLFSYMYCHGRELHASSFLATLTFIQNHIFNPMSTAAPAISAKRLLDIDFAVMKGGKAAGIRDFGSPVKTSLHTRTLVSFLGFAEMAMGVMSGMLGDFRLSETLRIRVVNSLERWCDAIIFIFFTFVMFHRFSGVKKVSLESALRLVMGQTHAHTNKVRATKRIRFSLNNQTEPEKNEIKCFKREDFREEDVDASALTLSHPHLLGLPYAVQAALGIPVSKINPLMTANSGGVGGDGGGKKYRLGSLLGVVSEELGGEFPEDGETAGNLGMFENFVDKIIDDYYTSGSFSEIIRKMKKAMEERPPYNATTCLISGLEEERKETPTEKKRKIKKYALSRDVEEYLMASPMKLVFIMAFDSKLKERYLSVGDLAILAIWVKSNVLNVPWDAAAIGRSNYDWIGSKVCKNLLLSDLTNFGIWGDLKIVNRLDTHTEIFHRDNERLPSANDQKNFVKNTSLDDRKSLAMLHSCVNVRTRTHLGRVTSTSWAVDALRTFTKGDKDTFAALAVSLDLHHLGHTNSANFVPYFSTNYVSNEQEMGLWGYIRRTSEKLAKEELAKGRFCNLDKVGIANSNVAAAALAVSSCVDLGEVQAVLDDGAKTRKAALAITTNCTKSSLAREKLRADGIKRLLNKQTHNKDNNYLLLKDLWSYFASPSMRQNLLKGKPVQAMCPRTGFLNAAVPDFMIDYSFDSSTSCIKLRMKLLPPIQLSQKRKCPEETVNENKKQQRMMINNEDAVMSLDTNITAYDKFNLAETEEVRQKLVEQDKQCRIAAGIKKVCERIKTGATKRNLVKHKKRKIEETVDEQIQQDLDSLAYIA
uniref:Wsv433-like protein n=1 Tax=Sesarmops intermedium nimavirus TaxID=2133796 RepID=A0A401IPR7_9VIRU|nr:MAG: wsv433-like protein [Sesarmops intermedium nimavirus]GBG35602.1 wsv433-like protein [Sesarmops intermedium nimavirus]